MKLNYKYTRRLNHYKSVEPLSIKQIALYPIKPLTSTPRETSLGSMEMLKLEVIKALCFGILGLRLAARERRGGLITVKPK